MKIFTWLFTVAVASIVAGAERDGEARKELAGVWDGRVDEGATGHQLTFTPDHIAGKQDEKQYLGEGGFKLDLLKQPRWMDATGTKGPQRGRRYLGIYALDGDTLKWCVSTPGNERPTEFATKNGQFLLILKRQK